MHPRELHLGNQFIILSFIHMMTETIQNYLASSERFNS